MRKFFTVIARIIASIFAILFVITTILALLLTTLNRQLFKASLYKNALAKQNIYERLPEIVGIAITSMGDFLSNPCAENPLACSIDGASPELQTCLTTALGPDAYEAIGSGQRKPTDAELQLAQPCLDQNGSHETANVYQPGEIMTDVPLEVQACIEQAIGKQVANEIVYDNKRLPTETETQQIQSCFDQFNQSASSSTDDQGGMPSFFQNLTAADYQTILTILLPPRNLQSMVESTLDQLFAYLNGETDTVTISLIRLKERLAGQAGTDLIMQLINAQPACTEQELAQMSSGTSNGGMVLCKPPEDQLATVVSQLQEQLDSAITGIPDEAVLIKPLPAGSPPPGSGPFGADPITTIRMIRLIMRLSPLLPLAFLLLVTLFGVRTLKGWMRWWGIPIFFAGILALALGIAAAPVAEQAWVTFVAPRIPPYIPTNIADIGHNLVGYLLHSLTEQIALIALILAVFGLAAWIISYFIKTKTEPEVPVLPPAPAA